MDETVLHDFRGFHVLNGSSVQNDGPRRNGSILGFERSRDGFKRRAFSCAIATEQSNTLSRTDCHGHAFERQDDVGICHLYVVEFQHGHIARG